jgi:ribosome biogenesis GTPase / thiamine phosphate phosphatase
MRARPARGAVTTLAELGWDEGFASDVATRGGASTRPARVIRVDRGMCTALDPETIRATTRVPVAVGDWVVVGPGGRSADHQEVRSILPRRSAFLRKESGPRAVQQVVASNVDIVLLVNGLDAPLNDRGLERYLTLGWQSGAVPVIVLNKADDGLEDATVVEVQEQIASIALDVEVHTISARTGSGIERLADAVMEPGRTIALLGPSGAGKSTLVNRLAGADVMKTGATRGDAKGRHTTTHRELIVVPGRGLLIDTPGMRELALWDADEGLAQAFADVEQFTGLCRFSDCAHLSEPGCAVRTAVADGSLEQHRFDGWHTLKHELDQVDARRRDRADAETEQRRRPIEEPRSRREL